MVKSGQLPPPGDVGHYFVRTERLTENEPLVAGPIEIRDSVKSALYSLRHFMAYYDAPNQTQPASIEISLIESVEEALACSLPYEAIACLANNDGYLDEYGISIRDVVENTASAHSRGQSADSIAFGRHPDDHAFYCISKRGPRSRSVHIVDVDNFDGSRTSYDLAEWLSEHVERRQQFTADDYPEVRGWAPSPDDLAAFSIILLDS